MWPLWPTQVSLGWFADWIAFFFTMFFIEYIIIATPSQTTEALAISPDETAAVSQASLANDGSTGND